MNKSRKSKQAQPPAPPVPELPMKSRGKDGKSSLAKKPADSSKTSRTGKDLGKKNSRVAAKTDKRGRTGPSQMSKKALNNKKKSGKSENSRSSKGKSKPAPPPIRMEQECDASETVESKVVTSESQNEESDYEEPPPPPPPKEQPKAKKKVVEVKKKVVKPPPKKAPPPKKEPSEEEELEEAAAEEPAEAAASGTEQASSAVMDEGEEGATEAAEGEEDNNDDEEEEKREEKKKEEELESTKPTINQQMKPKKEKPICTAERIGKVEFETLNDEINELNSGVQTLKHSYAGIIKSLMMMQNQRRPKKKVGGKIVPQDPKVTFLTTLSALDPKQMEELAKSGGTTADDKYNMENFLNPVTREDTFQMLFKEVEELNKKTEKLRTFFDARGNFLREKYDQCPEAKIDRKTFNEYKLWTKYLNNVVMEIARNYNDDVLNMFRLV